MSKLKDMRQSKGLKQIEVAKHFGISKQQMSGYENGSKPISFKYLLRFSNFYNCKLSELVEDSETLELLKEYEKQNN